ncbi:metal ABC transporter substrate-binding protein [Halanaerocella petrolearia]
MNKKVLILSVVLLLVLGSGLIINNFTNDSLRSGVQNNTSQLKIYTSIYPLYDLATKIADDKLEVNLVVPNGAELHSYKPSPRKIAQLEKADLFFYNGLGVESWANKTVQNLTEVGVKTVRVSQVVNLKEFVTGHEHNEGHEHKDHEGEEKDSSYDPHIWLDPMNMKDIAKEMRDEFIKLDSKNKEVYQANYKEVVQELEELDQEYKAALKGAKRESILVSHSAFGYLADRYGFKQLSVTGVAPHQEPSPGTLAKLTKLAKEHKFDYIFMETLANPRIVNVLAKEAELKVLKLNPVAGLTREEVDAGEDYFSLMRQNLNNLQKALGD